MSGRVSAILATGKYDLSCHGYGFTGYKSSSAPTQRYSAVANFRYGVAFSSADAREGARGLQEIRNRTSTVFRVGSFETLWVAGFADSLLSRDQRGEKKKSSVEHMTEMHVCWKAED
jgi:hypothetical protein